MQKTNGNIDTYKSVSITKEIQAQMVYRGNPIPEIDGINWTKLKDHAVSQRFPIVTYNIEDYLRSMFGDFYMPVDASWRLITHETGEGLTNKGAAIIVCGMRGEPMVPFTTEAHEGKPHAEFAGRAFVIVEVTRKNQKRDINLYKIEINSSGAVLINKFHSFSIEKRESEDWIDVIMATVPPHAQAYSKAIAAACEKSGCYHCRHVHYSEARLR
jgi:hypothetical protein